MQAAAPRLQLKSSLAIARFLLENSNMECAARPGVNLFDYGEGSVNDESNLLGTAVSINEAGM
ncbi:MAG: hypothetical protein WAN31_10400 [Methylovirgula sp.]